MSDCVVTLMGLLSKIAPPSFYMIMVQPNKKTGNAFAFLWGQAQNTAERIDMTHVNCPVYYTPTEKRQKSLFFSLHVALVLLACRKSVEEK